MFIQVMEGRVTNPEGLQAQLAMSDLHPGAEAWLGTTAGLTADGRFIAVTSFESQEGAKANSDRPEQSLGWEKTAATYDRADRAALKPLAEELDAILRRMRPDVIGGTAAWPGDGTSIQTVYFSSEAEARAHESAAPISDEDRADAEPLMSLMQVDRSIDLPNPMLYSR